MIQVTLGIPDHCYNLHESSSHVTIKSLYTGDDGVLYVYLSTDQILLNEVRVQKTTKQLSFSSRLLFDSKNYHKIYNDPMIDERYVSFVTSSSLLVRNCDAKTTRECLPGAQLHLKDVFSSNGSFVVEHIMKVYAIGSNGANSTQGIFDSQGCPETNGSECHATTRRKHRNHLITIYSNKTKTSLIRLYTEDIPSAIVYLKEFKKTLVVYDNFYSFVPNDHLSQPFLLKNIHPINHLIGCPQTFCYDGSVDAVFTDERYFYLYQNKFKWTFDKWPPDNRDNPETRNFTTLQSSLTRVDSVISHRHVVVNNEIIDLVGTDDVNLKRIRLESRYPGIETSFHGYFTSTFQLDRHNYVVTDNNWLLKYKKDHAILESSTDLKEFGLKMTIDEVVFDQKNSKIFIHSNHHIREMSLRNFLNHEFHQMKEYSWFDRYKCHDGVYVNLRRFRVGINSSESYVNYIKEHFPGPILIKEDVDPNDVSPDDYINDGTPDQPSGGSSEKPKSKGNQKKITTILIIYDTIAAVIIAILITVILCVK